MTTFLLGLTSFSLGIIHGFDTDHVLAVTNFVSQDPRPKRALKCGFQFGLGHTSSVLLFALFALSFKYLIPESFENVLETGSGLLLVALGIWVIWSRFLSGYNGPEPTHQHEGLVHRHGPAFTGVITGLAGTAGVMLFGPVVSAPSFGSAMLFILLYGLGIIISMSIYGLIISKFYRLTTKSGVFYRAAAGLTGVASIAFGLVWLSRIGYGAMTILKNL